MINGLASTPPALCNGWQDLGFLRIVAVEVDGAEDEVAEVGVDELGFVADFYVAQVFAGALEEFGRVGECRAAHKAEGDVLFADHDVADGAAPLVGGQSPGIQ